MSESTIFGPLAPESSCAFTRSSQSGMSLIEVLVALVITLIGLLGLTGLIARANQAEMESYQRVQALMLLQDMVDRINANRTVAACYSNDATGRTVGTGFTGTPTCTVGSLQQNTQMAADLAAWSDLLQGSAEVSGSNRIGAMIGARGCVAQIDAASRTYIVTVAWQGLAPTVSPVNPCGKDLYGSDDKFRRVVTSTLRIGSLI